VRKISVSTTTFLVHSSPGEWRAALIAFIGDGSNTIAIGGLERSQKIQGQRHWELAEYSHIAGWVRVGIARGIPGRPVTADDFV